MTTMEEFRAVFQHWPAVQLAVLFGSSARGRATPRSDVDVAVRLAPDTPETRRELYVALHAALKRPIDLVFVDRAPPLLRLEIARHGQPIVERQERGWVEFKARAMIDWGDWAPYARRMGLAAIRRLREEIARGQA